jgi:hypothetical protein
MSENVQNDGDGERDYQPIDTGRPMAFLRFAIGDGDRDAAFRGNNAASASKNCRSLIFGLSRGIIALLRIPSL